jgi:hypothetical protein
VFPFDVFSLLLYLFFRLLVAISEYAKSRELSSLGKKFFVPHSSSFLVRSAMKLMCLINALLYHKAHIGLKLHDFLKVSRQLV